MEINGKNQLLKKATLTALSSAIVVSSVPLHAFAEEFQEGVELSGEERTVSENENLRLEDIDTELALSDMINNEETASIEVLENEETLVESKTSGVDVEEVETSSYQTTSNFNLVDWYHTENGNEIILNEYQGSETSLYIPGEFNGKQVALSTLKNFSEKITDLVIQEVNGKKVKVKSNDFSNAFHNNKSIISLDLKGLDTSNVTNMSYMFAESQVKNLDVSNWDTSNVTDMSFMFDNARQVQKLDLSNWDTSNVTNMQNMFGGIPVQELDLSNWDTSNVRNMCGMFVATQVQ